MIDREKRIVMTQGFVMDVADYMAAVGEFLDRIYANQWEWPDEIRQLESKLYHAIDAKIDARKARAAYIANGGKYYIDRGVVDPT